MAALFTDVAGQVDELTDLGVARIQTTVGAYAHVSDRHRGDLWWSAKRSIQMMLACLGQQRGLNDDDLASRQLLGMRAAERGIPLESVMHAMRLGCILVWDALLETAGHQGPAAAHSLLVSAGLMWLSFNQLSSAIADGHRDASAVRDEERRRRSLSRRPSRWKRRLSRRYGSRWLAVSSTSSTKSSGSVAGRSGVHPSVNSRTPYQPIGWTPRLSIMSASTSTAVTAGVDAETVDLPVAIEGCEGRRPVPPGVAAAAGTIIRVVDFTPGKLFALLFAAVLGGALVVTSFQALRANSSTAEERLPMLNAIQQRRSRPAPDIPRTIWA